MLNKTRRVAVLMVAAILCVTAAGPAAADFIVMPDGCTYDTKIGKKVYCPARDTGTPGTKDVAPVRQLSEEEINVLNKVRSECDNMKTTAEAAGRVDVLDGDAFYQKNCVAAAGGGDPGSAAREVAASMQLQAPSIGMTPRPGPDSVGLVGVPNWMWVENPEIFETVSDSASIDAGTITVSGRVAWVDWDMGDGQVVRCKGPGTSYVVGRDGWDQSPDCGHVYTEQGEFTVTATAHWVLEWSGGGRSGAFTIEEVSTVPVTIGEWQVRVKRG